MVSTPPFSLCLGGGHDLLETISSRELAVLYQRGPGIDVTRLLAGQTLRALSCRTCGLFF